MSDVKKPASKTTTAVTTYDPKTGMPVKTVSSTPLEEEVKAKPTPFTPEDAGLFQAIVDANPSLADLIERAAEAKRKDPNGIGWTEKKIKQEYAKTTYALERTKAQELFDIGMSGPDADVYQKQIDDQTSDILRQATIWGVKIDENEARQQATLMIRSALPKTAINQYFATKYKTSTTGDGSTASPMSPGQGTVGITSQIQNDLRSTARSYGLMMNDEIIQQKTGEALAAGDDWRTYLEGQKDYFKNQAKLLYPKASNLLDTYNISQIGEQYWTRAASRLGISMNQMDPTDPKWTTFLNGENGVMSVDEWERTIMTNPDYGWDRSNKAREEFANLGDQLLSAFARA